MAASDETTEKKDRISEIITRLLAGPSRPGQAFTMPGMNYDGLYGLARRLKACFDGTADDSAPVCICTDDRGVTAAVLLAALAGGPVGLLPHDRSAEALATLQQRTGFTRAIAGAGVRLPAGVTAIDVDALTDETESLQSADKPAPEQCWVKLSTATGDGGVSIWSKSPRALLTEADLLVGRFAVGSADRILSTVSAHDVYGLVLSVLLPLLADARVVAATPATPQAIAEQMAMAAPTIFVGSPTQYASLGASPVKPGGLRLAFCGFVPLAATDGQAFTKATGADLVEIFGSPATGGIATRCQADDEPAFIPYAPIVWRVAGRSLDIQSPLLSPELPVRSNGWYTAAEGVSAHGSDGFVPPEHTPSAPLPTAIERPPAADGAGITVEPAGRLVPVDPTQTLQTLIVGHGIDIRADCGGAGICGKCRVLVDPAARFSAPTSAELKILTPEQLADGSRLACQARALGKGTVTIPDSLAERAEARGKTGIADTYPVEMTVRRLTVAGGRPDGSQDNTPESLLGWIAGQADVPAPVIADVASLRQLGRYRGSLKSFTLVTHADTGISRILDGHHSRSLGFAVDLGTTSVAGYLCDLSAGKILAAEACVNPQRRFGEDVISRICHVNEKDAHLEQLQRLAADGINTLMKRCLEQIGDGHEAIDEIAVCGNTTMEQIAAGLDPHGLGISPYVPLTLTPPRFHAGDLGLACDAAVPVHFMPMISGFVGGDTMAAILADRPHEREAVTLIVDIGTNGEIVLGNRDGLWVTSCATGPALEGAQISCGMRAVTGAIHRVWPDDNGVGIAYAVLGEGEHNAALGICGSGIIDAIAALRQIGAILPNGRLNEAAAGVETDADGIGRRYRIATDRAGTGGEIAVTLKDIRQIQLAKSALCVGIDFLMRKAGIAHIDRTVLTGAFGAHFNWQNALSIGMLPPAVSRSRVATRDNLAGVGVVMALLDRRLRAEAAGLCRRIRYLELAAEPDFAMAFARATAFPEKGDLADDD